MDKSYAQIAHDAYAEAIGVDSDWHHADSETREAWYATVSAVLNASDYGTHSKRIEEIHAFTTQLQAMLANVPAPMQRMIGIPAFPSPSYPQNGG